MHYDKILMKFKENFQILFLSFSFLTFFIFFNSFSLSANALNSYVPKEKPKEYPKKSNIAEKKQTEDPKNDTTKRFEFNDNDLFPDLKKIQDRGELIVAMYYQDKPPFYFTNKDGKLVGNDPELADAIATAISPNIKVRYIRTAKTFDEIIQQVHDGKADIAISKLSYTIQRSKRVLYSKEPYIKLYVAFMISRSAPSALSLSQIFSKNSNYKLCAIKGSSQVKFAQKLFPYIKIIEVQTAEETVQGLNEKKCIASIRDDNEIRKILLDDPKLNLRYKAVILKDQPDPIFIVTDPVKPNLDNFINQLLENNPQYTKTLNQIFSKYKDQLR